MKTLGVIFIIIGVSIGLIGSISHQNNSTISLSTLSDITDTLIAKPDAKEIVSLLGITGEGKWNGGEFRYSTVSDVSYNKHSDVRLSSANKWLSNEPERDKEIKQFQKAIDEILSNNEVGPKGKRQSSVYLAIARELNYLSQKKVDRKYLLLYSDLMENTSELSFYSTQSMLWLKDYPDSVRDHLNKLQNLNNLTGITVIIIYQPENPAQDQIFRVVSEFYRKLLEEKGATVTITANLN